MHGFAKRSEVPAVLAWIDEHAARLPAETCALEDAVGRTLAVDVIAPLNVPGFDRAAMDGYALRGAETAGAGEYNPLSFPVHGQAMPGQPFEGAIPRRCGAAHHDRRADARRCRRGGARRICAGKRREDRDHATRRAGPVRRAYAARTSAKASPALSRGPAPARAGCRTRRVAGIGPTRRGQATARAHPGHRQRGEDTRHAERQVSGLRREFVHAARSRRTRRRRARTHAPARRLSRPDSRSAARSRRRRDPGIRRFQRRTRGLRAAAPGRAGRTGRSMASRCGRRVPPGLGRIGETLVFLLPGNPVSLPVRVRFLRRPRHSTARRTAARLAAPHTAMHRRAQDRVGRGSGRLLPRATGGRQGRTHRAQRRLDSLVDDARRRFRASCRPKARAMAPAAKSPCSCTNKLGVTCPSSINLPTPRRSEFRPDPVPQRRHARRGHGAIPRAPAAGAAGQGSRAAHASVAPRAGRRCRGGSGCARLRPFQCRRIRSAGTGHVRRHGGNAAQRAHQR